MADKSRRLVTPGAIRASYLAQTTGLTRGYGVMVGTSDDQVIVATPAAVRCVGVVEEDVSAAGGEASIVLSGPCVAIAGAPIARGDRLSVMDGGKFEPANAADIESVGYALCKADADTDEFLMFVDPLPKRAA